MPRASGGGWSVRRALGLLLGVALGLAGCGKTREVATATCRAPRAACGAICVDFATDAAHCGSCDAKCPAGDTCVDGTCPSTKCPARQHACDDLCVDLDTNPLNCGGCNVACDAAATCVAGACRCEDPATVCDGVCVDTRSSATNCGGCGQACGAGETCESGVCVVRCAAPTVLCGDACVDVTTERGHCGTCDTACAGSEQCVGGLCTCPDDGTHRVCNGSCVDLTSDGTNCGACGVACPSAQACVSSTCQSYPCSSSIFYCPRSSGDPLAACLAQASTAQPVQPVPATGDAAVQPLSPDLACQCTHCLTELGNCARDPACADAWLCGEQKACTSPCWGGMGVCGIQAPACFKFCASPDVTATLVNVEALFKCTRDNHCGI